MHPLVGEYYKGIPYDSNKSCHTLGFVFLYTNILNMSIWPIMHTLSEILQLEIVWYRRIKFYIGSLWISP